MREGVELRFHSHGLEIQTCLARGGTGLTARKELGKGSQGWNYPAPGSLGVFKAGLEHPGTGGGVTDPTAPSWVCRGLLWDWMVGIPKGKFLFFVIEF